MADDAVGDASTTTRLKPVLFHRRDESDSRAARELAVALGFRDDLTFEDVSQGSSLFESLHVGVTPSLWDGEAVHQGLAAVVSRLVQSPTPAHEILETNAPTVPESYTFGEEIKWDASWAPMTFTVELPFWLMVANCHLNVALSGHEFDVEVRSDYWELYVGSVTPSRDGVVYLGKKTYDGLRPDLARGILESRQAHFWRPCRTVLRIASRCNSHVIELLADSSGTGTRARRVARSYLVSMCEIHLPIVNRIVQSYRLATYDYFAYEVSPWDVPIWYCTSTEGFERVVLLPYAGWNHRPQDADTHDEYTLITPEALQEAVPLGQDPAEFELIDAANRMERGDYTGAVRRVTTALEAELERVLRAELARTMSPAEVNQALEKSKSDFLGRLRQYEKLRHEKLPDAFRGDLENTRNMRHEIVHTGARIAFEDRGRAQRAVDTGRWMFNWLQNDPARKKLRETKLAYRSLGRNLGGSGGRIEKDGAVVDS